MNVSRRIHIGICSIAYFMNGVPITLPGSWVFGQVIIIYLWTFLYVATRIAWDPGSKQDFINHELYLAFWVAISFGWNWQLLPECGVVVMYERIIWICKVRNKTCLVVDVVLYMCMRGLDGAVKSVIFISHVLICKWCYWNIWMEFRKGIWDWIVQYFMI